MILKVIIHFNFNLFIAGMYSSNFNSTLRDDCIEGIYSEKQSTTSINVWLNYPAGTYSNLTASNSFSNCIKCNQREFSNIIDSNSSSTSLSSPNCILSKFKLIIHYYYVLKFTEVIVNILLNLLPIWIQMKLSIWNWNLKKNNFEFMDLIKYTFFINVFNFKW